MNRYFSLFWLGIAPICGDFVFNFQEIRAGPFVPGFRHGKGIARKNGLKIGSSGCSDRCYLVFVSIDVSRVEVGRPLKSSGIDFLFFEFLAHCFLACNIGCKPNQYYRNGLSSIAPARGMSTIVALSSITLVLGNSPITVSGARRIEAIRGVSR